MKNRKRTIAVFVAATFIVTAMTACGFMNNNGTGSITQSDENISITEKQNEAMMSNNEQADIGEEKAKTIAFSHADVKESEVSGLRVERDLDDGRLEYQVEFYVGNKEYNYEISGEDGTILDYDVDIE